MIGYRCGVHFLMCVVYVMVGLKFRYRWVLCLSTVLIKEANLEIQMTAEQHTKVFLRNQAAGAKNPSPESFAQLFSRIWDDGMSADDEAVMEERWSTLERVFTPLYFPTRDWVPSASSHLDQIFEENFSGRLSFRLCIVINVLHL